MVVLDGATLIDLGVGDGDLSHGVSRELADVDLLYEHVAVLSNFVCRPITYTLFL